MIRQGFFFMVASASLNWINVPDEMEIGESYGISLEAKYDEPFKLTPYSLTRSFLQQESPLPPPFYIIEEIDSNPEKASEGHLKQKVHFNLKPKREGKFQILLEGELTDLQGNIKRIYGKPLALEVKMPQNIPIPIFPRLYDPRSSFIEMNDENIIRESRTKMPSYVIEELIQSRRIPIFEILLSFLCACGLVIYFFKKSDRKKISSDQIITRFGLLRRLKALAESSQTNSREFFYFLERELKSYLKIPMSLTRNESLQFVHDHHVLRAEKYFAYVELMQLVEENKYSLLPNKPSSLNYAIQLTQTCLD